MGKRTYIEIILKEISKILGCAERESRRNFLKDHGE
jgi:hypothetical protein